MRKFVLGLAGAAALTMGSGANAAPIRDEVDSLILFLANTEDFGAVFINEAGDFSQVFNFDLFFDYSSNGQVSSILLNGNDIDFSSILLDGNAYYQTGFDPNSEVWQLDPVNLAAGAHSITVIGSVVGASEDGSFVGTINLAPPVPEPATWAMMLLGFGTAGLAIRRRRRKQSAVSQLA